MGEQVRLGQDQLDKSAPPDALNADDAKELQSFPEDDPRYQAPPAAEEGTEGTAQAGAETEEGSTGGAEPTP